MNEHPFYLDDEEEGLSPETSHPHFKAIMTESFYYDCTDDFSPFGNDDGADLMFDLEEWYRETKGEDSITEWLFETIDEHGFDEDSKKYSKILDEEKLKKVHAENPHFIDFMDNMIIAAAFGQFKITGKISSKLKETALIALECQQMIHAKDQGVPAQQRMERFQIMARDLHKAG